VNKEGKMTSLTMQRKKAKKKEEILKAQRKK